MKQLDLTPHIVCSPDDFAKTVLMPGDPLRAKMIADTFLEDAELVNNIRGVQGYTGYYQGKRVSVMASGMGMPSIGIYSYELFRTFGVESIIRIGSAGGVHPDLKLFDIVIAQGACYNSVFPNQYGLGGTFTPIADFGLLRKAVEECERRGLPYKVGNVLSTDIFYAAPPPRWTGAKSGCSPLKWKRPPCTAMRRERVRKPSASAQSRTCSREVPPPPPNSVRTP